MSNLVKDFQVQLTINHLYLKIGSHFNENVLHVNMLIKIFTSHQESACNLGINNDHIKFLTI